jgi:hypothetical protein
MTRTRLAATLLASLALAACGGDDGSADGPPAQPGASGTATSGTANASAAKPKPRFDANRAMRLIKRQVDVYGQRPAGSAQLRRLAVELRKALPRGKFEQIPGHPRLRNVVGMLPGAAPAVVVAAHYDTEVRPKGFVGANDGAAGTAAVVEIARAMRKLKRPAGAPEIRFVLFDGEEEPRPTDDFYEDALRGSKAYAAAHASEMRSLILLDYIANRALKLPRERNSTIDLWERVVDAANRVGKGDYFTKQDAAGGFIDDHTPFLRAGVPAVDLIDGNYKYADTLKDTVDKLSVASLDAVGETVVELLRTYR